MRVGQLCICGFLGPHTWEVPVLPANLGRLAAAGSAPRAKMGKLMFKDRLAAKFENKGPGGAPAPTPPPPKPKEEEKKEPEDKWKAFQGTAYKLK